MKHRQEVTIWLRQALLRSELDSSLRSAGFARRKNSLCYRRHLPEMEQEFELVFQLRPSSNPLAEVHLLPVVRMRSLELGTIVRKMVEEAEELVARTGEEVLCQKQIQNVAPQSARKDAAEWYYIVDRNHVAQVLAQLTGFVGKWVVPFLDEYRDKRSLVHGYEQGDERLHDARRFYLCIAAACIAVGEPAKARQVLERWFGRPAIRKRYSKAFDFVAAAEQSRGLIQGVV